MLRFKGQAEASFGIWLKSVLRFWLIIFKDKEKIYTETHILEILLELSPIETILKINDIWCETFWFSQSIEILIILAIRMYVRTANLCLCGSRVAALFQREFLSKFCSRRRRFFVTVHGNVWCLRDNQFYSFFLPQQRFFEMV